MPDDDVIQPVTDMDAYDAELLAMGFEFEDEPEADFEDGDETELTLLVGEEDDEQPE